ncbi:hypothetical protein [Litchfieldia alkalitelluris]|uniref:hypothetical protein n=1 Tax=Litchfieldia alkalitelluris TaxID=304268 RepID=UPI000996E714|nr:hypothetical protein [Litchfieldia alkalitelluris]
MENFFQSLLAKTREVVGITTNEISEKINTLIQQPTFSVEELAAFVATHPDTSFKEKSMLGIKLNSYELLIGDVHFHLETKGHAGEYILELLIRNKVENLFQYYSYEHNLKTNKPLRLSNNINELLH